MGNKDQYNKKNKISFFKSFIPMKTSNEVTLNFFEFLRKTAQHNFPNNLEKNIKNFEKHILEIEQNNGYIENQNNYTDMFYGNKTIAFCGCEIIATYNAIYDITGNHDITFPIMIDSFEKDGIVLSGFFGTAPRAIEDYLKKIGFKTISSSKKEEFDNIGYISDALILTLFNDKYDITNMVHTISITKKNGQYYIHNNGYNCHLIPYSSMSDLLLRINGGISKEIFLIGIIRN